MRTEIYSEEHRKLREILRRERVAAGLRQSDLAERTGRSQAYISKFENGDLRLDVMDFVRFCNAIGCNFVAVMDEVFGEPENLKVRIKLKEVEHTVVDVISDIEPPNKIVADTPSKKPFLARSKSDQHAKKH